MAEARAPDWATLRRRRWSGARIAAALALHVLVLATLTLAIDRVRVPRHGQERETRLLTVTLRPAPPPPAKTTPAPAPTQRPARDASPSRTARDARPVTPAPPLEHPIQAITLPTPETPPVTAVTPAASAPDALRFLDSAATRQAIRAVARGDTLASQGNALTHEDPGSEMAAADGAPGTQKRDLPPPPPAAALAQGIAAAHKNDCMKGEYPGGGMGLLSAPFLLAAEAMGKCAHKL